MAAQAFVVNGARVFIASRKEGELKKVRECIFFILFGESGGVQREELGEEELGF